MYKPSRPNRAVLIALMFSFFAMGIVDLVGIASNYVKADFKLSDSIANIFPSMVYLWFFIGAVPSGMLMNKIGRRKTVLIGLAVTEIALLLPFINYSLFCVTVSFSLIGIGNTIIQVSLNPLISNIVAEEKLASSLSLGQLVKSVASFAAPVFAGWSALYFGDWKIFFLLFFAQGLLALALLAGVKIKEEEITGKLPSFGQVFVLLKNNAVLLFFIGIMCHVGIDVGTNVTAPKILTQRLNAGLEVTGYSSSIYFLFRVIGSFIGVYALAKFSNKIYYAVNIILMALALAGFAAFSSKWALYSAIALMGLANSNIFTVIFSQALMRVPSKKNEVSGLMIMAICGGTLFLFAMGLASDALKSQNGAVAVMFAGIIYLLLMIPQVKKTA